MAGRTTAEVAAPIIRNVVIPGSRLPQVEIANGSGLEATGSFVSRALEHLRGINGFGGLPAEFQADPNVSKTSGGVAAVHVQQQFKSIPIFLMGQTVRFGRDGTVLDSTGASMTLQQDLTVEPRLTAIQAAQAAARHSADLGQSLTEEKDDFGSALVAPTVDVSGYAPTVLAAFPDVPTQPTVLSPGPFAYPVKAQLTWFPGPSGLKLGWETTLSMPKGAGQYRIIIDANTGAVLYSKQILDMLTARGSVYVRDGSARTSVPFPRPWTDYAVAFDPGTLPTGVPPQPAAWVDDTSADTAGNCVRAHLDDNGPVLKGRTDGGAIVFEPDVADGDDQKILNMFYFNSYLHDVFYLLGFREEDGNFQLGGVGGVPGDPVDARAYSGPVWGTANMFTPPDGTSPTMNMGLVAATGRHTAFDATVVFHEYMHGVTNRLVGGPLNTRALEVPQSKAMGEGWGDYIACTLTGTTMVGQWVANNPMGIRSAPYDDNYPGTFGKLGTGIYVEAHRAGEIWCATLMAMNRALNLRLGEPRGQRLALQLVVDALKLSPANPSMIDMRDAILLALKHKTSASPGLSATDAAAALTGVWTAFAKFGMGTGARSPGTDLSGVVEDFSLGGGVADSGSTPGSNTGQPTQPGGPTGSTTGGTVKLRDTERTVIPDNDPAGVKRVLHVPVAGTIKAVTVSLDISHTYVGDLLIKLVPPTGSAVVLYNQAYKDDPDLVASFSTSDVLAVLKGRPAQGDWVLSVADLSAGEVGALRSWGLVVDTGAPPGASGAQGFAAAGGLPATGLLDEVSSVSDRLKGLVQRLRDSIA